MNAIHRSDFQKAEAAGFHFWGNPRMWMNTQKDAQTGQRYIANMRELAQDAALANSTITTPNTTVPVEFTAYMDTEVTEILTAPRAATELFSEEKKGNWTTSYDKFRIQELTGTSEPYSDYAQGTTSGYNAEWATRGQYLFQTVITAGDLEVATSAEAKINLLAEKQRAAATVLAIDANAFYLNGVAGQPIYGILNDPNLPEAITAGATGASSATTWASKGTVQIYNDILAMYAELAKNSNGLITPSDPLKLAVSPASNVYLGTTNDYGKTVMDLVKQYFPNMTVVVIPELQTTSETTALLVAPSVMGQKTAILAYSEKLRTGRVINDMSSVRQKWTSTTFGGIVKLPFAICQMTGL